MGRKEETLEAAHGAVIKDVASLPRQTQKGPSDNWARRVEDHPEDED